MRFIDCLLCCGLLFLSCESPAPKECVETSAEVKQPEAVSKATGDNLVAVKEQPKKFVKDKQENHARIVEKYGEQWDFCTCVTANDSINKASQNGLTEKQADKLMKRWEYIEGKCREFMTNPNTTPDERLLHEKKVEKCLKGG